VENQHLLPFVNGHYDVFLQIPLAIDERQWNMGIMCLLPSTVPSFHVHVHM